MAQSALSYARKLLKRRKFSQAITLLESREEIYENNFDYYNLLGISLLYVGNPGDAMSYFSRARRIKVKDTSLLLGQAAIYLRRGDTDKAIQYYLDIQYNDPGNKTAAAALEFIRKKGNYSTICEWVDNGKIEKFYPPIPSRAVIFPVVLSFFAAVILAVVLFNVKSDKLNPVGPRANLTALTLSEDQQSNAQEKDMSNSVYHYILSNNEILKSYSAAQKFFQEYRDNAAQVEINRLLNSNASLAVKQKARLLMSYLKPQTFDSLKDNYAYSIVSADPLLYIDCWVAWSGRVANVKETEKLYSCDLFVGYENMKTVDGIVPLYLKTVPVPDIDTSKSVRVLAKVKLENGRISLEGSSVYQSVKNNTDDN